MKIGPFYFRRWGLGITHKFAITVFGYEFDHKGDWVIWLWPWRRNKYKDNIGRMKYISTSFESYFPSLKAIDALWEEYEEHCRQLWK